MLKDEPKWNKICDATQIGSGSKMSNPGSVEEGGDGNECPDGRKIAKRKSKQKANNIVVEVQQQ